MQDLQEDSGASYPGDEIAREAFLIMMRREWFAVPGHFGTPKPPHYVTKWGVRHKDSDLPEIDNNDKWMDPFTALVEANAWWKANVEGRR